MSVNIKHYTSKYVISAVQLCYTGTLISVQIFELMPTNIQSLPFLVSLKTVHGTLTAADKSFLEY